MNAKQEQFCLEYLIDMNATQAAIRAGYNVTTAYSQGQRLLKHVEVHARIEELKAERSENTKVTADYVVKGLQEVAERCLQKKPVMVFNGQYMEQATDEEGNNVWQFDSSGANKALELLGKHTGIFEKDNSQKKDEAISSDAIQQIADKINQKATG